RPARSTPRHPGGAGAPPSLNPNMRASRLAGGTPALPGFLLALAAGGMMPFAYAPYDWKGLAVVALAIWLELLARTSRPFAVSFAFGLGWFGLGSWWLATTFHHYGQLPWPAAIAFQLLVGGVLALFPALWGWIAHRISNRHLLLIFPLLALPEEWLRGHLFTGLPWTELGNLALGTPWIGWGSIVGGLGLSLIAPLLASAMIAVFYSLQHRSWRQPAAILFAIATLLAITAPAAVIPTTPKIQVALVQPNIPQDAKWSPDWLATTMQRLARLSATADHAELIVWPEAATPFFLSRAAGWQQWLRQQVDSWRTPLLFGGLKEMTDGTAANGAWLLSPGQQQTPFVGKHHLVPFGEYVPSWVPWLHKLVPDIGDFHPAQDSGTITLTAGGNPLNIGVLICYESIFADEMRQRLEGGANLLAVLTNDAWYDHSPAAWQHLQAAQMRAVESGRFVLRAANTGVSAIIAPDGTIRATIDWWQQGVVQGTVSPSIHTTPYSRFGDWPIMSLALLLIGLGTYKTTLRNQQR
ncbi:MAG: apolipoprotein N-acyltransferase, partial [Mariprofundales bacterium]